MCFNTFKLSTVLPSHIFFLLPQILVAIFANVLMGPKMCVYKEILAFKCCFTYKLYRALVNDKHWSLFFAKKWQFMY